MAVVIRLLRGGGKKQPHYRIVVADSRNPRDGKIIEKLGYYNPKEGQNAALVNKDRANYWIGNGARVTNTVRSIFKRLQI